MQAKKRHGGLCPIGRDPKGYREGREGPGWVSGGLGLVQLCLDLWVLGHSTTSKWWRMILKFSDKGYIQDLTLEHPDEHWDMGHKHRKAARGIAGEGGHQSLR